MKKILPFLFCLVVGMSYTQEIQLNYSAAPLKTVLVELQKTTGISFSYAEDVIAPKTIDFIGNITDLTGFLTLLSTQTGLLFEKVSDTQVVISRPSTKINVCGYLFESDFNTPLPYATVLVASSAKGTTSDENGYFKLDNIEETSELLVQYIGFSDLKINALEYTSEDCKNILMKPQAQYLQEVVVTAYLTTGIDKNANGSFTLKNKDLGVLPGLVEPDVFQSIQMVPGITSLDESAAGIQIRGGSPDQNLIYFDDIKMYNTGHFFGMISAINPFVVESAEIFKGGASPEYGDRISGVIDINSATDIPKKTTGGVGVNGTHADGFLKARLGKNLGLIASGRRSYTDAFQTPAFNALSQKVFQNTKVVTGPGGEFIEEDDEVSELIGNENFFFYDFNGKLLIQPSKNDIISISGLNTFNDLDFFSRNEEDVSEDKLSIENRGASFDWHGTKFKKLKHGIKGYYSYFNSDYNNTITEELQVEEENQRQNSVEDYGFDVNLAYEFLPKHNIKLGYQYSSAEVFFQLFRDEAGDTDIEPEDDEENPIPEESRDFNIRRTNRNQANTVYAAYSYKPKNKGLISVGLRGSHYSSVDELYLEPRLNIEYPLSKSLRFKGTVEQRYQPISQLIEFEDTQLRLENAIWTLSNDTDIPVLESFQVSGGLMFNTNGWTLDIDGYSKNISGLTSFTNGFTNSAEEIAVGESTILGVDVLLRKQINNYRIWLGYTFNDVEYAFAALQNNPFPGNNDITHNLRIANTLELKNWELSLGWNYRTGTPFTPTQSFNTTTGDINFGPINSLRLPNYHRLDASLRYTFGGNERNNFKSTLGLSVQNIYNRQEPISVFYRVDENPETEQNELDRIEQLSLGFMPNATLRLFF